MVGNVIKQRVDEEGKIRYGTASFTGGTKVYLSRPFSDSTVAAVGLNRHKSRYVVEYLPLSCIETFRSQQVYQPRVLEIMNDFEFYMDWWGTSDKDRIDTDEFVRFLKNSELMKNDVAYAALVRKMWHKDGQESC